VKYRSDLALTPEEARKLLAAAKVKERDYMLFFCALNLGLRSVEICHLKLSHLASLKRGHLLLVPTAKSRKAPLDKNLKQIPVESAVRVKLLGYLENLPPPEWSEWAFRGSQPWNPLTTSRVRMLWRHYADKAGIPKEKSFHSLRHTRAVNIYRATRDLFAVKRRLRHANIRTTESYMRWLLDQEEEEKYRDVVKVLE
jgi:integrase